MIYHELYKTNMELFLKLWVHVNSYRTHLVHLQLGTSSQITIQVSTHHQLLQTVVISYLLHFSNAIICCHN